MKRVVILAALLSATALPTAAFAQTATRPTYEQPLSGGATRDVQTRLRALGYYGGPIDGVWGDGTRVAVERFQRARRVAVTGQLNQATVTAMGLDPDRLLARGYAPRAAAPSERAAVNRIGPETTRDVQERLQRRGLYGGPIDGTWGPNTSAALAEFQRRHHLAPSGEPSRDTLAALGLDPDRYLSGSSGPADHAAERLNRRELDRVGD
jgi:peptidoglycan hydrolase-like protein with peptidoglycan-binding domain